MEFLTDCTCPAPLPGGSTTASFGSSDEVLDWWVHSSTWMHGHEEQPMQQQDARRNGHGMGARHGGFTLQALRCVA